MPEVVVGYTKFGAFKRAIASNCIFDIGPLTRPIVTKDNQTVHIAPALDINDQYLGCFIADSDWAEIQRERNAQ